MPEIRYDNASTSEHSKILKAINERVSMSEKAMSSHHTRWQEAEKYYMLYKKKNQSDYEAKEKEAKGGTDYKSVVMPYAYANLLTAHTYMVNVFLNRVPIFPVEGIDGAGADKELAMESLLQYQVRGGEMEMPLFIWLLDILRYGIGFTGNYWHEEMIPHREFVEEEEVVDGVPTGNKKIVEKHNLIPGYKGNKVFNLIPYDALPDPRVPFVRLQDGEFFGRKLEVSYSEFKRREAAGLYFNFDKVKTLFGQEAKENNRSWTVGQDNNTLQSTTAPNGQTIGNLKCVEMYVELIPSEWGLGESIYPEKWVFTVANKTVIIGADPLGYYHNKFPFHAAECEADGYKQESRGLLEVAAPLNDIMTWLFDTHMYNKRQVMNNQFVYDPSRIVTKDLQSKTPGKMIRMKATAYGQDIRTMIHQLPVTDVTQQNYQDLQVVNQQMQQTLGINDDVAGRSAPSSRRSAAEFRGTTSFAANRLANMAYYISITGFRSLGQCLISSTQQMYDVEMKVKIAGDTIKGAESITVNPEDIAGKFDIVSLDGTMPLDRMSQAQFWMQVLQMTGTDPDLQLQYRRGDIFSYMARLAGLKNIDKFKLQVVSDEELVAMIKARQLEGVQGGQQQPNVPAGGTAPGVTGVETAGAEASAGAGGLSGLGALFQAG